MPKAGYTWHNYAGDLAALLDHLDVESAHVVGCSMGGGIALMFALLYPERVRSLVLADSALPGFTYSPEFSAHIQSMIEALQTEGAAAAFERLWLTHPFFDGIKRFPERLAQLRETVLGYAAPEYQADYPGEGDYEQPDVVARLHEIAAPTLVVVGEHDVEDFRLIAEVMAGAIPRGRLQVVADAWHVPNMEKVEEFNGMLVEWLGEVEGMRA